MEAASIDTISYSEFKESVEQYICWASEWDGDLPADVFFGVWSDFQQQENPVEVHARIVEGKLRLSSEPGSPIRAEDNRIWLEDGREVVIQLEPA